MRYDITSAPDKIKQLLNYQKLAAIIKITLDLDLYSLLGEPVTASRVAQSLGADEHFATYLLDVLCAVDLVTQTRDDKGVLCYHSAPIARQYLDSKSALYLGTELFDTEGAYRLLERYVREGPSTIPITTAYWTPDIIKQLESVALLGAVQDAIKLVDIRGRTNLLDIGGGHGLYSIFFAKKYPGLRAVVLDLPHVIDVARENITKHNVGARVAAVAGDYRTFESDRIFDVILMSNVTPSRDELRSLLLKAHSFLVADGIVLLRSFIQDSTPDVWSRISTLERYARRGRHGFTRADLIKILSESNFTPTCLYEGDGVIVLQGV